MYLKLIGLEFGDSDQLNYNTKTIFKDILWQIQLDPNKSTGQWIGIDQSEFACGPSVLQILELGVCTLQRKKIDTKSLVYTGN